MSGESAAYKWLRQNIFTHPHRCDRVENLMVAGMPDVNVKLLECAELWLEIKAPVEPKRATTRLIGGSNHPVSVEQANWFLRQRRAGGRAAFWVATDKRRILVPGAYADRLNDMTLSQVAEASAWLQMNEERLTWTSKQSLLLALKNLNGS